MISMHNYFGSKKVGPEFFTSKYHTQQLFFSCCVVLLSFIQNPAGIVNYSQHSFSFLAQDSPQSYITSVAHNLKRQRPIRCDNDRGCYQSFFEYPESIKTRIVKYERSFLFKEICHRFCNFGKVFYVAPIKTCM